MVETNTDQAPLLLKIDRFKVLWYKSPLGINVLKYIAQTKLFALKINKKKKKKKMKKKKKNK